MEAAPWIGMARSFIKRMDVDKRPTVDVFLAKVLRIRRRHALEYVFPTNPVLPMILCPEVYDTA
jgi:hypothetical protein